MNAIKKVTELTALTILALLLFFCGDKPPAEEQIIQKIQLGKAAIETLDIDSLDEVISENFEVKGDRKNIDYDSIRRMLALYSIRKQNISLTISPPMIEMDKHNTHLATSEMTVLITASRGLIPDDGRIYKVTGNWRLYDDEWMLTRLTWK